jgi:hypothetical protein
MRKSDLEPRVPLAVLRLFSVLILVLGSLAGIIQLGSGTPNNVAAGVEMIIAAIAAAALLSVIAAICDNLILIRKDLSHQGERRSEGRTSA